MHAASVRPWVTTGIALVGASVIAVTPIAPPPPPLTTQVHIPVVQMPDVELSASIVDIFTFPALRQYILNRIDDVVTLGVGLAGSAAGLGRSITAIPSTLVTATQQLLARDPLAALTTLETYLVGSIVAVGGPTLAAIIARRTEALAVREALQVAIPTAVIQAVGGLGQGADEILRAFIVAGQGVVNAVLSFSPGAIVSALVDGTRLVVQSFAGAGQHVVDGIVAAQQTIATALATQPAATMAAKTFSATVSSPDVTDVPDLGRKTATLSVSPSADPVDTEDSPDATTPGTTNKVSTEKKTPKPKDAADQSSAKDSTPAVTTKSDDSGTPSTKADTGKKPKREHKKAGDSESDGDTQK
jgi:hypothetical protein